jgi:hypothetical protein
VQALAYVCSPLAKLVARLMIHELDVLESTIPSVQYQHVNFVSFSVWYIKSNMVTKLCPFIFFTLGNIL